MKTKGRTVSLLTSHILSAVDNGTGLKPSLIHRFTQSALAGRMISETWLKLLPNLPYGRFESDFHRS